MKTQSQPIDRLTIIFILLLISTIYVAFLTIPVGTDLKDIYIDATITKPAIGSVSFTSLTAHAQPHTFISPPSLGSIIASGTVVVTVSTTSRSTQSNVGEIYRTFTEDKRIILKSVPIGENEVTIKLYEDNILVQTQKVVIQ